jgi:hypothetical protein
VIDQHEMPDRLVARPAPQPDVGMAGPPTTPAAERSDGTGGTHQADRSRTI